MARLSRSQAAASARYLRPYTMRLYLRGLRVRSATHTATSRPTLHRARMRQSATADRTSSSSTTRNIRWLSRQASAHLIENWRSHCMEFRFWKRVSRFVCLLRRQARLIRRLRFIPRMVPCSRIRKCRQRQRLRAAAGPRIWLPMRMIKKWVVNFFTIAAIVERQRRSNVTVPLL